MACKKCKGNHFVYKNDNLNTENTRKFVNYETEFCDECKGVDNYTSQVTGQFNGLQEAVRSFFGH
jgi:hypothetical protein